MARKSNLAEPKTLVEGAEVNPETTPQPELAKPGSQDRNEPKPCSAVAKYTSNKYKRRSLGGVRRSQRLQNAGVVITTDQNMDVVRVIEEVTVSESEMEDEEGEKEDGFPEPVVNGSNLEENVGYMDGGVKKGVAGRNVAAVDGELSYKNLYFESQKKIKALMDENHQLLMKLEHARGQIEVYEKQSGRVSEVLDKLKDVVVLSSLTKASQTALNLSPEAVLGTYVAQGNELDGKTPAKRRRIDKEAKSN